MAQLIPLANHPSNLDRTATLISGPIYRGRDIYRVRGGFLATLGDLAIAGLFNSEREAAEAQTDAA